MHPASAGRQRPSTTWRDRLQSLRNIRPLLRMVWETSPPQLLGSAAMRLLKALLPLATLFIAARIVDHVVARIRGAAEDSQALWLLVGLELGLAVAGDALGRGISLCDSLLGDRFTNKVSIRLIEHASSLDLAWFEDPEFHDRLERARRQTTSRIVLLSQGMTLLQEMVTLASLSAGLLVYSPALLLLLAVAVLPSFLGETHFANLAYSMMYQWTPQRRELDYLRFLGASSQSAKEVRIFGLETYLSSRYRRLSGQFFDEHRKLAVRQAGTGALLNVVGTCGYYAAYAVILARTVGGGLTVGTLTMLAGAFARSRSLIEGILLNAANLSQQALNLRDLFEFLELEPRIRSKQQALPAPRPIRDGFVFENVSFQYPGAAKPVLVDVNFHLEARQKIALIGENGSGKTTLVKLLARLYDPTAGRILLDGADLRDYSLEDLRNEIGVIFQDYVRYDLLVKENIGVGRVEAMEDEARVRQAAEKSMAAPLIARLGQGFDQMVGRRFDGGVDLSGGEWQKLALARAYMRDAQLLILDEPTATLDARAEYEVFQRFAELTRDRTAVLISHRFSTVRMADRILVLENGRILEQGAHEELLRLHGRYAELFELQAAGYR